MSRLTGVREMGKILLLGLALAVLATGCGRKNGDAGSVWQWVDEKGAVQFAADLDDVPEAYRARAGKIPMSAKAMARKRSDAPAPAPTPARPATAPAPTSAPSPVGTV